MDAASSLLLLGVPAPLGERRTEEQYAREKKKKITKKVDLARKGIYCCDYCGNYTKELRCESCGAPIQPSGPFEEMLTYCPTS